MRQCKLEWAIAIALALAVSGCPGQTSSGGPNGGAGSSGANQDGSLVLDGAAPDQVPPGPSGEDASIDDVASDAGAGDGPLVIADGAIEASFPKEAGVEAGPRPPLRTCPIGQTAVLLAMVQRGAGLEWHSVDPATGKSTPYPDPRAPKLLDGLNGLYSGSKPLFDPAQDLVHIIGPGFAGTGGTQILYTIDAKSGDVLRGSALTPDQHFLPSTLTRDGTLVKLEGNAGSMGLRAIDPRTGACTTYPMSDTPQTLPPRLGRWGNWATDTAIDRLYVPTYELLDGSVSGRRIMTIDLTTASLVADAKVRFELDFWSIGVNRDGALLGLYQAGNGYELRSIDPMTGLDSAFPDPRKSNVVSGLGLVLRSVVLDNDAGRMYVLGYRPNETVMNLFVIDARGSAPTTRSVTSDWLEDLVFVCRR
jgi:hypothetical protein